MNKPVLVVMAAGMGSRYGSLKQIDPIGPSGEIIIDYSVFDAVKAGFEKVIFIIKKEIEQDFKNAIGNRFEKHIKVEYAFQDTNNTPKGFTCPDDRVKPWGTAHAVLSAKHLIDGSFAVINADDFYGADAFKILYDFLSNNTSNTDFCMVGYQIENTLTENGTVSRGVCEIDENNILKSITERRTIAKDVTGAKYTQDDGETWVHIKEKTLVSMNLWGFTPFFLQQAEQRFSNFLAENLDTAPLTCEYYLPTVVSQLIDENMANVTVLHSKDKWYGVTYSQDKPVVQNALKQKHIDGDYTTPLWK